MRKEQNFRIVKKNVDVSSGKWTKTDEILSKGRSSSCLKDKISIKPVNESERIPEITPTSTKNQNSTSNLSNYSPYKNINLNNPIDAQIINKEMDSLVCVGSNPKMLKSNDFQQSKIYKKGEAVTLITRILIRSKSIVKARSLHLIK